MRNIGRFIHTIPSICLALLMAGCAGKPAAPPAPEKIVSGDQMFRDSQGIAQLGSRWQEGKQMVDKGQSLQREGQMSIDQGQKLIDEGQKIMRESEEGYKTIKQ